MISYGMILFHEEDTNYNNNYINHIRYFDTVPSKKFVLVTLKAITT